ncbi:DUF2163 domain-containing protein [Sphingomonas sp.]|uniref:DUF2163 domain-containing protein n=1 Tax=Sphingomonas sp. TaxID=28214 RepID=UPI003BACEDB5
MKASTPELRALLATRKFVSADIWTLRLNGGAVVRWSGADIPIMANGNTFALGPAIDRGSIVEKVGLEVATLLVNLDAGPDDRINSIPLIAFIARRGLDGASVKLERAFAPDWSAMRPENGGATGTVLRFAGKVTSVGEIMGTHAEITVSAWTILLNVSMPANLYQVPCLHTVYDVGCGLDPEDFKETGTVTGTPTGLAFTSTVSGAAGLFAQGRVVFTSGANAGISRTVKDNDGSGGFSLIQSLPAVPAPGDAFAVYQGCDLAKGTCETKFANLGRFKATPYVPLPETAI